MNTQDRLLINQLASFVKIFLISLGLLLTAGLYLLFKSEISAIIAELQNPKVLSAIVDQLVETLKFVIIGLVLFLALALFIEKTPTGYWIQRKSGLSRLFFDKNIYFNKLEEDFFNLDCIECRVMEKMGIILLLTYTVCAVGGSIFLVLYFLK